MRKAKLRALVRSRGTAGDVLWWAESFCIAANAALDNGVAAHTLNTIIRHQSAVMGTVFGARSARRQRMELSKLHHRRRVNKYWPKR